MIIKLPRNQGSLALITLDWHCLDTYLPTCSRSMIGISHLLRSVSLAFARVADALVQLILNLQIIFKKVSKISSCKRDIRQFKNWSSQFLNSKFFEDSSSSASLVSSIFSSSNQSFLSLSILPRCSPHLREKTHQITKIIFAHVALEYPVKYHTINREVSTMGNRSTSSQKFEGGLEKDAQMARIEEFKKELRDPNDNRKIQVYCGAGGEVGRRIRGCGLVGTYYALDSATNDQELNCQCQTGLQWLQFSQLNSTEPNKSNRAPNLSPANESDASMTRPKIDEHTWKGESIFRD